MGVDSDRPSGDDGDRGGGVRGAGNGQGEPSFFPAESPGPGRKQDLRLLETAIKDRWPIPEQYREALVRRLLHIALDPASKEREVLSATRCLLYADRINLGDLGDEGGGGGEGIVLEITAKTGLTIQDLIHGAGDEFDSQARDGL